MVRTINGPLISLIVYIIVQHIAGLYHICMVYIPSSCSLGYISWYIYVWYIYHIIGLIFVLPWTRSLQVGKRGGDLAVGAEGGGGSRQQGRGRRKQQASSKQHEQEQQLSSWRLEWEWGLRREWGWSYKGNPNGPDPIKYIPGQKQPIWQSTLIGQEPDRTINRD